MNGFVKMLMESFLLGGLLLAFLLFIVKSEVGLVIAVGVGIVFIIVVIILILRGEI